MQSYLFYFTNPPHIMKTSKKYTSAVLVILTTALLSWNNISDSKKEVNAFGYTYLYGKEELNNDDLYALIENEEQYFRITIRYLPHKM